MSAMSCRKMMAVVLVLFLLMLPTGCDMMNDEPGEAAETRGKYVLSVEVEGEGEVLLEGINASVSESEEFELETGIYLIEALSAEGYRFLEWQGALADKEEQETAVGLEEDETVTAVFVEKQAKYIIDDVEISAEEIEQGEDITVEAEIENAGYKEEKQEIELLLSPEIGEEEIIIAQKEYSLPGGESGTIEFENKTVPKDMFPGEYNIMVRSLDDRAARDFQLISDFFEITIENKVSGVFPEKQ